MDQESVRRRKKIKKATRRDKKAILDAEIVNVNFVGIEAERERLRKKLRISQKEWRKVR